ncbi:DUF1289 domain-containing protein [Haloplanus ruber]|uniref:DUF1289 domain-containing protein n=1 Tax=Haloplanus ruber TaxID=869892 RepID=A0ABD6CZF8_9EURY
MKSPCIRECTLAGGRCPACGRTRSEIINWASMTEEERREVMERLDDE